MRILLAGYNVDADVIGEMTKNGPPREDATPETLSASYARISRDPRPIDELRRAAREEVGRARKSNRNIIFKMGHHSVAEHAVFNFDLIGVSRLAIEDIERFRLCSFTEKSQRYITLGEDFVVPVEIREAGLAGLFEAVVRRQNSLYHRLLRKLVPHVFSKHAEAAGNPGNHSILEGWAKEDARYVVSLATQGQLGLTTNARNLELMIRRFAAAPLAELREINDRLYALAKAVAPSIILFTEAGDFDARTRGEIGDEVAASGGGSRAGRAGRLGTAAAVELVQSTPDADLGVLAALVQAAAGGSYKECLGRVRSMTAASRRKVMKAALRRMEFYDFPLREFEHADLTFDLVVSASCYAQLKRHRMATLTCQPYDPGLGVVVPPSIREIGAAPEFMEVIAATEEAHASLRKAVGPAADYVLTNAHRRRALLKTNARELYHISRLREDAAAQWDIRKMAARMSVLARKAMPLTCLMLGGKDAYGNLYERVFGGRPAVFPPPIFK
jgi:flavin-dependent thymidylate synthase